jgi:hypothetical protein
VLSLYRKVLDQRLLSSQQQQYGGTRTVMTDQLRFSSSSSSEAQEPLPPPPLPPASPSTTIVSVQSSYRVSRFKVEQRQQTQCQTSSSLPLVQQQQQQQQQQCHGSSSVAATTQGFKRPHSAIGAAGQSKTRYGSFLSTSFHCIDEEPNMGVQSHVSSATSPGVSFSIFFPILITLEISVLVAFSLKGSLEMHTYLPWGMFLVLLCGFLIKDAINFIFFAVSIVAKSSKPETSYEDKPKTCKELLVHKPCESQYQAGHSKESFSRCCCYWFGSFVIKNTKCTLRGASVLHGSNLLQAC